MRGAVIWRLVELLQVRLAALSTRSVNALGDPSRSQSECEAALFGLVEVGVASIPRNARRKPAWRATPDIRCSRESRSRRANGIRRSVRDGSAADCLAQASSAVPATDAVADGQDGQHERRSVPGFQFCCHDSTIGRAIGCEAETLRLKSRAPGRSRVPPFTSSTNTSSSNET